VGHGLVGTRGVVATFRTGCVSCHLPKGAVCVCDTQSEVFHDTAVASSEECWVHVNGEGSVSLFVQCTVYTRALVDGAWLMA